MCGIAGKVSLEAVAPGLIEAMCEQQVHRGPDSRGIHQSDGVALGIQRLRVIDLETGDQPIYNEDRSVAVVLNGEIYNYRELRRDLQRRGHVFSTNGDTEVIAHLYEERGVGLVQELNGMFAFAVWDEPRRRLLLARDRVGKKPLFYAEGDGWLSFASELRALIVDREIPREVDPSAIDSYLTYGCIPAPWTVWRAVHKLRPAHTLVWESGSSSTRRYWDLDYSEKRDEDSHELEEELRLRIGAAVRRRMIADVPLGAFLSGGVDSSIVVSEMAEASADPVRTFSIGFEAEAYNELPQARRIAERFSTDHQEFIVRPDAIEIIPKLVRHYGEPYADSSAIPSFYLAQLTRQHVTVALNGDGGDESFAGYLRYAINAGISSLDRLPPTVRRGAARLGKLIPAGADRKGKLAYARRLMESLELGPVQRYTQHVSVFNARERADLLETDFRSAVDESRSPGVIEEVWRERAGESRLDTLLGVDVNTYLPNDLLVKIDIATMAYSLEARSPLLDSEVMEFAASLPPGLKARGVSKKRILRNAYRGRVPSENLSGPKRGFAVPLGSWFRNELREYTRESLLGSEAAVADYVDREAVRSVLDLHDRGRGDHSAKIWALLMLSEWHRATDRDSVAASGVAGTSLTGR
jgi:asparagine synthase (glutamine-hydrolysing)